MTPDEGQPRPPTRRGTLPGLLREVRRARRRWLLRRVLVNVALAGVGAAVAHVVAVTLEAAGLLPVAPSSLRWFPLGVLGVGLVVALLAALRATPSERTMVRRADDAFELRSRLVTARDLEARPPTHAASRIMRDALVRGLEGESARVRAERLVPIRFRAVHAVAAASIVTAVLAASLVDLWMPARTEGAGAGGDAPAWSEADRGALATELEALAEVLEAEADESRDAYTRALSQRARELAAELTRETGGGAPSEADEDVQRLLAHVEEAMGSRLTDASRSRAGREGEVGRLEGEASLEGDAEVPLTQLQLPGPPGAADQTLGDVQDVRERLEAMRSRRTSNPYGADFASLDRPVDSGVREAGLAVAEEAPEDAQGVPAGAAERSTDAPGDAAGAGSQELDVGERPEDVALEAAEEVALPEARRGDGARVRASGEAQPDGEASVFARDPSGDAAAGLVDATTPERRDSIRRDSGAWRRDALDPHARLLAQRLFEPETSEAPE